VKVGVQIHPQNTTMADLRAAWQRIDQLGVDSLWTWDHFFPPLYGEPDDTHFEGWQLLAAMAVTTQNVRQIGMLVTGNGYRNPDLLADMARTFDHLSEGRAVLGIGAGWSKRDCVEYGFPVPTVSESFDALEVSIKRIRHRLSALRPGPLGPLPLLIGGNGERRALRLVAEYADMWNGFGDPPTFAAKNTVLDRWCDQLGRDPESIERTVWVPRVNVAEISEFIAAGATHIILGLPAPYDDSMVRRLVDLRS
jgi:probable F420-dependent oxidoreductase